MRKRRRLADKLTISVCAVLVAVSAFFYVPMDVNAEESVVLSGNVTSQVASDSQVEYLSSQVDFSGNVESVYTYCRENIIESSPFDFVSGVESDKVYQVSYNISGNVSASRNSGKGNVINLYMINLKYGNLYLGYIEEIDDLQNTAPVSLSSSFYAKGSDLVGGKFIQSSLMSVANIGTWNITYDLNIDILSCVELSTNNSEDYQNGYNAGYSAGEQAGYGNGYSNGFADGEASVDTDAIYDEAFQAGKDSVDTDSYYDAGFQAGKDSVNPDSYYDAGFQAGKDSVDTQSYYDAGYQAGYQVSYQEGYESGYDEGYQSAMDRIDGWGADSSDYPILKYSFFKDRLQLICDVFTSAPSTSYDSALLCYLDFDINPNHTYKFVISSGGASGGSSDALYSDFKLNFVIGSNVINANNNVGKTFDFFIPGYNMGSSILFEAFVYDCVYYGGLSEEDGFLKNMGQVYPTLIDCYIDIYDMGPSGDTQNHIANQTDSLTNGFDNSQGNSVNSDLSSGLNEYQASEDTLWATATTGLKDFTFFDFASVPAMITGMSFITAIMGSWFNQAGGASGVGIVLSILFSVVLVAMVLGLYRWYQSRGGKD